MESAAVLVDQIVAARSAEIQTLRAAIEERRLAGRKRVFQTLPRHLRRRAASHNVKRVMRRVRPLAVKEAEYKAQKAKRRRKRPCKPLKDRPSKSLIGSIMFAFSF